MAVEAKSHMSIYHYYSVTPGQRLHSPAKIYRFMYRQLTKSLIPVTTFHGFFATE